MCSAATSGGDGNPDRTDDSRPRAHPPAPNDEQGLIGVMSSFP